MEYLTDMEKTITQTAVFFKGALLMELLMDTVDLSCLMAIIIKERLNMEGQMDLVHLKLIIPHIRGTLKIMSGMDKVNKKVKDTIIRVNINMDKRNQVYINIMEMSMRVNL